MKVAANYAERNGLGVNHIDETRKLHGFHTAEKGVRKCR
jgi:hypothetical protein